MSLKHLADYEAHVRKEKPVLAAYLVLDHEGNAQAVYQDYESAADDARENAAAEGSPFAVVPVDLEAVHVAEGGDVFYPDGAFDLEAEE